MPADKMKVKNFPQIQRVPRSRCLDKWVQGVSAFMTVSEDLINNVTAD